MRKTKKDSSQKLKTKSGAELTPALEAELTAEAEVGFDPAMLTPRKIHRRRSTQ